MSQSLHGLSSAPTQMVCIHGHAAAECILLPVTVTVQAFFFCFQTMSNVLYNQHSLADKPWSKNAVL